MADFEVTMPLAQLEAPVWYVVFHENTTRWWVRLLAAGRFRHVSAFAWFPAAGVWVFFDTWTNRTRLMAVRDATAAAVICAVAGEGTVVVEVSALAGRLFERARLRPVFSCTTQIAHLLGLPSCALRPDALFEQCLAIGGRIMEASDDEIAKGRP